MATMEKQPHKLAGVGRFALHYIEMCAGMCIGTVVLALAFFGTFAVMGFNLVLDYPGFSTLLLAVMMSVAMIAWMRIRKHEWRPTLEMGSATMVLGIVLVFGGWRGLIPVERIFELETSLACPSMLIPMLLRYDIYSRGHQGHDVGHAVHS